MKEKLVEEIERMKLWTELDPRVRNTLEELGYSPTKAWRDKRKEFSSPP